MVQDYFSDCIKAPFVAFISFVGRNKLEPLGMCLYEISWEWKITDLSGSFSPQNLGVGNLNFDSCAYLNY